MKLKYPVNERTVVLYNGLDVNFFTANQTKRQLFRTRFHIADEQLIIGIAGTICPGKGVLPLINAFKKIAGHFPNILLLICGSYALDDKDYNATVKDAIESDNRIVFVGYIDDMPTYYNGCDIVINNSDLYRSESLGTSIYEAMACEKLLVASITGGTPEIITDKINGFLYQADNEEALKTALSSAIANYANLKHIQQAARVTVIDKFNVLTMVDNYNKLLKIL